MNCCRAFQVSVNRTLSFLKKKKPKMFSSKAAPPESCFNYISLVICALFPSGQNVQPVIYVETAASLWLPQGPLLLSGITLSSSSSSSALCADLMHWNLCVTQRSHLEDRATVCELWWRVCWPAAMQTMPYSLIFRGHGLRETRRGGVMVSRFLPWKQQCGQHVSVFWKNDVSDSSRRVAL